MAKRTYTGTTFTPDISEATVRIFCYDVSKYEAVHGIEYRETKYTGVTAWDIIEGGAEAEEIERDTDESSIDENHEYLVLHFEDGTTSTFRNSHVDMFIR